MKMKIRMALTLLTLLTCSARAATNVQLNYTWQQINSNLAYVAAGHVNWDISYGWGPHTNLYPELNTWYATNAWTFSRFTNAEARITAGEGFGTTNRTLISALQVSATNLSVGLSNLTAIVTAIPTNVSAAGLVSNSTFSAYTNAQHAINTNTTARLVSLEAGGFVSNFVFSAQTNAQHTINTNLSAQIAAATNSGTSGGSFSYWINAVIVSNAGYSAVNGIYTNTSTATGTNAVYRSGSFDIWFDTENLVWEINPVSNRNWAVDGCYYLQGGDVDTTVVGAWTMDVAGTNPAPTSIIHSYSTTNEYLDNLNSRVSTIESGMTTTSVFNNVTLTGQLSYADTAWDDLTVSALNLIDPPGPLANPPTLVRVGPYLYGYEFAVGNVAVGVVQTKHAYKAGTSIIPHLHTTSTNAAALTNTWTFGCTFGRIAQPLTNSYSASVGYTNTALIHAMPKFPAMTGLTNLLAESSIIGFVVSNSGPNSSILLDVDFHFEIEKPGSNNEAP